MLFSTMTNFAAGIVFMYGSYMQVSNGICDNYMDCSVMGDHCTVSDVHMVIPSTNNIIVLGDITKFTNVVWDRNGAAVFYGDTGVAQFGSFTACTFGIRGGTSGTISRFVGLSKLSTASYQQQVIFSNFPNGTDLLYFVSRNIELYILRLFF